MPGGIFCIENWSADLRSQDSVWPLLDFLNDHGDARIIRQRVSTSYELRLYMRRFAELRSYQIAYLALHGERGRVYVGSTSVELEQLVEPPANGRPAGRAESRPMDLTGKVLYLGSCASLDVSRARLRRLRARTGAAAIFGYTAHADWYEAAAVDVMLLSTLAAAVNGSGGSLPSSIRRVRQRSGALVERTVGLVCEPDWRPAASAPQRASIACREPAATATGSSSSVA